MWKLVEAIESVVGPGGNHIISKTDPAWETVQQKLIEELAQMKTQIERNDAFWLE